MTFSQVSLSRHTNINQDKIDARYQMCSNMYVTCQIQLLRETEDNTRLLIGVEQMGDTKLAKGTRLFPQVRFSAQQEKEGINAPYLTVIDHILFEGKYVHICTPLQDNPVCERRQADRVEIQLDMRFGEDKLIVRNGSIKGLGFIYPKKSRVLPLGIGKTYTLIATHKERDYPLEAEIRHITLDWRHYQHFVGVALHHLDKELETVLQLLMDPNYQVDISASRKINASEGKISLHQTF